MRTFVISVALTALVACSAHPKKSGTPADAAATDGAAAEAVDLPERFDVDAIDRYLAGKMKAEGFIGLSVAIAEGGNITFAKGYGERERGAAAVTVETAFSIGSVTKQFVTASVLLLAEDGKLSPYDKVSKYYPGLTRADDITLLDLMNHVSGYRDYYPLDFLDRRMATPIEPDALLQQYAGAPLDFEPRTRWSYSNTGYTLLGRIVEKVSGEPLGVFMKRRIFEPFSMTHTAYAPKGDPSLAKGYTSFALGPIEPAPLEADGWLTGAAGIYSTPTDLAKWGVALASGRVLENTSYDVMTSARGLPDGRSSTYGGGLGISQPGGERLLSHTGAVSGFLSYEAIVPRTKSVVILLSNRDDVDAHDLHAAIVRLLLARDRLSLVPKVAGPTAKEVGLSLFHQLQSGAVERSALSAEYSDFLTPAHLAGAASALRPLGEPTKVVIERTYERGGREVTSFSFKFKEATLTGDMFRSADGKVQQFVLAKE